MLYENVTNHDYCYKSSEVSLQLLTFTSIMRACPSWPELQYYHNWNTVFQKQNYIALVRNSS